LYPVINGVRSQDLDNDIFYIFSLSSSLTVKVDRKLYGVPGGKGQTVWKFDKIYYIVTGYYVID
jgi:hypothetical protein